ncbi:hypothetical protein ACFFX1_09090 [Dactylosporangium sucinum]|uniref:hypothetical protein n=1 Tax=Dactylosporangium sucinum TaxID=1424081 RepID=UPI00167E9143|nr:hypothetical protein [Dactylosporangium sucinum]
MKERLAELQVAASAWDTQAAPAPEWLSRVTSESQTRLKLCTFDDDEGVARIYDMHARFTPGAGRVHFRMDRGNGRLTIGYIGEKLGI